MARYWLVLALAFPTANTAFGQASHELKMPLPKNAPLHIDFYADPLPPGAIARLGTVRWRHEDGVASLSFSPDGKVLCAGMGSGVFLLDVTSGKKITRVQTAEGHCDLEFSPDGKLLAIGSFWGMGRERGEVELCDAKTGKLVRAIHLKAGRPADLKRTVRFGPKGETLAVVGNSTTVYLLKTSDDTVIWKSDGLPGVIQGMVFAPDGKTLALGNAGPLICLVDAANGALLRTIDLPEGVNVSSLAFSPDSTRIALGLENKILLHEVVTGKEVGRFETKMATVFGLAFTPDGKALVSGSRDGTVRLWDTATGMARTTLDTRMEPSMIVKSMALTRDGKTIAFGGPSAIRFWDLASGKELFTEFQGHDNPVTSLAFSAARDALLSGDAKRIYFWNTKSWRPVRHVDGGADSIAAADKDRMLAAECAGDTIRMWNIFTGRDLFKTTIPDTDLIWCSAVSPDAKTVACVDVLRPRADNPSNSWRLRVCDSTTGRLRLLGSAQYSSLVFSPDGKSLFAGENGARIHRFDLQDGKEIQLLQGVLDAKAPENERVVALGLSPDGRSLLSGCYHGSIRLWETLTGEQIFNFSADGVAQVAIAPDGRLAVTACGSLHFGGWGSGKIRFWDLATGQQIGQLPGYESSVTALAFSRDGQWLVTGMKDSTILVWDLAFLNWGARLRDRVFAAKELERIWEDLAGRDARKAHTAIWNLTAAPEQALALCRQLEPAAPVAEHRIQKLIRELESDQFQKRQASEKQLSDIQELASPALRAILKNNSSLELTRRIEKLLDPNQLSPQKRQQLRAVQVLEMIGTVEARRQLTELAEGAPAARMTRDARASLLRMSAHADMGNPTGK